VTSASTDGTVRLWDGSSGKCLQVWRSVRQYERVDITDLTGVKEAERAGRLGPGVIERHGAVGGSSD
jgi:hypothetical protein